MRCVSWDEFLASSEQYLEEAIRCGMPIYVRRAGDIECFQALVAADAVILVDDEIALVHRRGFGDHARSFPPLARTRKAVAENVLLRDECELVGFEAVFDRQHRERVRALRQRRSVTP